MSVEPPTRSVSRSGESLRRYQDEPDGDDSLDYIDDDNEVYEMKSGHAAGVPGAPGAGFSLGTPQPG